MSKSVGNVVNPDVVIDAYGADSLRLFEMFLGPLEAVKPWSEKELKACIVFYEKYIENVIIQKNIPQKKRLIKILLKSCTRPSSK